MARAFELADTGLESGKFLVVSITASRKTSELEDRHIAPQKGGFRYVLIGIWRQKLATWAIQERF